MQAQALAQLVTHIPTKGESAGGGVRYYGFYSNKSRGLRKKAGTDDEVPALIDSDISRKAFRKNWEQLIQKVYNVDPLVCPKCLGSMKIISLIDDLDVIKKILKHLGLWLSKRPPPSEPMFIRLWRAPPEPVRIEYLDYQIPSAHDYLIDPDYPIDSWLN